jgi:hypothetical protein
MFAQDKHFDFYFSFLCTSAALALTTSSCGLSPHATIGNQEPFQMYETHNTLHRPVESCLDDNPNPPLSCM